MFFMAFVWGKYLPFEHGFHGMNTAIQRFILFLHTKTVFRKWGASASTFFALCFFEKNKLFF